jgi:hypothetical protein
MGDTLAMSSAVLNNETVLNIHLAWRGGILEQDVLIRHLTNDLLYCCGEDFSIELAICQNEVLALAPEVGFMTSWSEDLLRKVEVRIFAFVKGHP